MDSRTLPGTPTDRWFKIGLYTVGDGDPAAENLRIHNELDKDTDAFLNKLGGCRIHHLRPVPNEGPDPVV